MGTQDPQAVSFLQENLLLIGVVVVVIFGYLLLLIRKRWKNNFRHLDGQKHDSSSSEKPPHE
jgi:hypothetical protein